MNNVLQLNDVRMSQLLQKRNLPDRCARDALICMLQPYLLQSNDLKKNRVSLDNRASPKWLEYSK